MPTCDVHGHVFHRLRAFCDCWELTRKPSAMFHAPQDSGILIINGQRVGRITHIEVRELKEGGRVHSVGYEPEPPQAPTPNDT